VPSKGEHLLCGFVGVDLLMRRLFLSERRPDVLNHLTGPMAFVDDVLQVGANFIDIGRFVLQPVERALPHTTMAAKGCRISCAIDAVNSPAVATRLRWLNWAKSERSWASAFRRRMSS
jgi:hypothetical protein